MKIIIFLIALVVTGTSLYAYKLFSEDQPLGCGVKDDIAVQKKDSTFLDTVYNPNNITTLSLYHDTLFLKRTVNTRGNYTSYNYVYIDTNRSSKYYNWLTSFEFDEYDIQTLQAYGLNHVSCADDLKNNKMSGLPKNWLPVYSFNGEYYLYKPSDFGNAGKRIISEDYFIYWYMDGPMPNEIIAAKSKQNNRNVLILKDLEDYPLELYIHCVDEQKQLYVFEYPQGHDSSEFYLFTPAENAKSFDLVVNTGNEKAWEYNFDTIDFASLLQQGKF